MLCRSLLASNGTLSVATVRGMDGRAGEVLAEGAQDSQLVGLLYIVGNLSPPASAVLFLYALQATTQ